MARKKLPYKEGDWLAVPLRDGGYALGLAARVNGKGIVLGYFFGPRYTSPPSPIEIEGRQSQDAIFVGQFGDPGLLDGSWPVVGAVPGWQREDWPVPVFGRRDRRDPTITWRSHYDENTLRFVREERVAPDQIAGLPKESLSGYGFVEIHLSMLLSR